MLADRRYMRQTSDGLNWSAAVALVAALVICFLLQIILVPRSFADEFLALSLAGLRHGFFWQFFTYQFMHGGLIHLLMNCWAIYFFGRGVEGTLGRSKFLTLYFSGGVVGGLLQMLGAWLWPSHLGGAVVGASAGGFGLVAAFATLNPGYPLTMLLFFIVPITMRAKTLLLICLVLAGLGIVFPGPVFGGGVAHAAHLGGLLVGVVWIKSGWHRDSVRLPWEGLFERWNRWRPLQARGRKRGSVDGPSHQNRGWPFSENRPATPPSEEFISREVDPILDKISAHGIHSLTERERRILEAARNRMAKR
jgi:membrane associated rhomboid family serine protease